MMSILKKADYEVVYPKGLSNSCCGMLFNSRGFKATASMKGGELEEALMEASEGGKLPIVVDTSPCLAQIKEQLSNPALRFSLYEPAEFISNHLVDKLEWKKVRDHIAVHVPCSSKKLGVETRSPRLRGCAQRRCPRPVSRAAAWRAIVACASLSSRAARCPTSTCLGVLRRLLHVPYVRDEPVQPLRRELADLCTWWTRRRARRPLTSG